MGLLVGDVEGDTELGGSLKTKVERTRIAIREREGEQALLKQSSLKPAQTVATSLKVTQSFL